MTDVNNDYSNNPRFISKSKINRKMLNKWKVPKEIKVDEVKNAFDYCNKKLVKTGVSFDTRYQRHTNYVGVRELLEKTRDLYWDRSNKRRKK